MQVPSLNLLTAQHDQLRRLLISELNHFLLMQERVFLHVLKLCCHFSIFLHPYREFGGL